MVFSETVIRVPAPRAFLLPAMALLAGLACAGAGDEERRPASMRVVRSEASVEVEAGTRLDLVVTRPVAVPFERQYEWPAAPTIEGDAVRFLRLRIEAPPPEDDGGVTTHHYELEAVRPGAARVVLVPKAADPSAAPAPRELAVTVRAAPAP